MVLLVQAAYFGFWYGVARVCTPYGTFLLDLFSAGCFRFYGGLDFLVYPSLAFLAAAVFGNPNSVTTAQRRMRLIDLRRASHVASTLLALALVTAATATSAAEPVKDTPIKVGFRDDAEPFSFRVDPDHAHTTARSPITRSATRNSSPISATISFGSRATISRSSR